MSKKTTNFSKGLLVAVLLMVATTRYVHATTYYVSGTGSDTNDGLSTSSAFRSPQKAADLTNPGDVVYLMNGVYDQVQRRYSNHSTVLYISRSGTATDYISYRNYPGHTPKISGQNSVWSCVLIMANYIRFEGIEVAGNNQNITYDQAKVYYDYYQANKPNVDYTYLGEMNVNGVAVGESKATFITHHVEVRNCTVHDFQGGGIPTYYIDYITFENNTVYNNAWYGMYASSGISLFHSRDVDTFTGYKNFIRGNTTYNNKCLIPWADQGGILSDGNGIIIDDNKNTQVTGIAAYNAKTLVENNVSFNNGGSGMHAYSCANVDIRNNTSYNNGQIVNYAEIYASASNNCNVVNNIMFAKSNGFCNSNYNNTNVVYNYNLYRGTAAVVGPNDISGNPLFISQSTDPAVADFRVQIGSPAIDGGTASFGLASTDKDGYNRVQGTSVDIGAYESGSVSCSVPAAPTSLSATAISSSKINLTWMDNSNNETTFQVERKNGTNGVWTYLAGTGINSTTYTDSPLSASTTYTYRVRSANGTCVSAYSNESSGTTSAPGPSVQLEAENATGISKGLKRNTTNVGNFVEGSYVWFANVNLGTGYNYVTMSVAKGATVGTTNGKYLEVRLGSVTGTLIGTLETRGTGDWNTFSPQQISVTPVTGIQTIYIVGAGGRGIGYLDYVKFTNDPLVSAAGRESVILNERAEGELNVFPNPASNVVYIEFDAETAGTALVQITDPSGKAVGYFEKEIHRGRNKLSLDVTAYEPQLYFLKINDGSRIRTEKLLIRK